ncbi:hypothetical protein [Spirosoma pulveris]
MKHLFTSLLILSLTLTNLYAQESATAKPNRFGIGAFVGLNHSYPLIIN